MAQDGALDRARRRLDQRTRVERELLAACLALPFDGLDALAETASALHDPSHVVLVPWVQARLEGKDPETPPGSEEVVAEVYALIGRWDPAAGIIPDEGAARVALRELVVQVQLRAADDEIGPLRVRVEDGSASGDEMRRLSELQRVSEVLRTELRAMNVPDR